MRAAMARLRIDSAGRSASVAPSSTRDISSERWVAISDPAKML